MIPPNATGKAPRVLFLADGGPQIGGGHAMRCLTLAGALAAQGASCAFVGHPGVASILDVFRLDLVDVLSATGDDPAAMVARSLTLAEQWNAHILVVDSYRLAETARFRAAGGVRQIVVIEDLADRPHDCDLLIDPTFARAADAYRGLVPPACRVLIGPEYALVRPAFAGMRGAALARRTVAGTAGRVLVALGLTDVGGITGRVVQALAPVAHGLQMDVVVGRTAPSLAVLADLAAENPGLHLHVDAHDMAELTATADIGVGAGGSSVWERACLGLPSVSLILTDNQGPMAMAMDKAGALIAIDARRGDMADTVASAGSRLIQDGALRTRLAATSSSLCDGAGAGRVASAILAGVV